MSSTPSERWTVDGRSWRVGDHYRIHVYRGDVPVATFHTSMDAIDAVRAHNDALRANEDDEYLALVENQRGRALATIERVKALHVCSWILCRGCKAAWPCPTIEALEQP